MWMLAEMGCVALLASPLPPEIGSARERTALGDAVAEIGDANGDGVADFIVGCYTSLPDHLGYAFVFSGEDFGLLHGLSVPGAFSGFGQAVAEIGDIDGDGRADFAVKSAGRSREGRRGTVARLYAGSDGFLVHVL